MKYSNALIFILAVTLTVDVLSVDPWICSPDNNHRCPSENQTCCPSIHAESKYVCFNSPNGVCCPDDQNFCPHGTVCNMDALKCEPAASVLTFLSEAPYHDTINDSIIPMDNSLGLKTLPAAGDILKFSTGFVKGFALFSDLPEEHDCLDKVVDPSIPNDVVQIFQLVKSLNLHSDFISVIKSISWYAVDIYTKISDAVSPCKDWSVHVEETGTKILNVFVSDKYIEKLGLHLLLYLGDFKEKATKGYDALIAGDYHESGLAFGDLLRFGLLWDYKN